MKAPELFREIRKGNLLPLYYFWGPEKWLLDEALRGIEGRALTPETREFNRDALDAGETTADAILASLQAFPVRSPWRLVVVRRADLIWKKTPLPFVEYFQDPNPRTCAVFVGEKADLRAKFFLALEKKGAAVSFFPPFEKDLGRWIHSQAEHLGHPISEDAALLLAERVGPSLQEIHLELQKLALRKKAGGRIEEEDVLALTADTRSESPFELPQSLGRLRPRESVRLLGKTLQQGEPPVFLLSLLVRQIRLICRARSLRTEGLSPREAEGRLRIPPRNSRDFWAQVDGFPPALPERLWTAALKADQRLKGSRADKGLLLEEYLFGLLFTPREARKIPGGASRKNESG